MGNIKCLLHFMSFKKCVSLGKLAPVCGFIGMFEKVDFKSLIEHSLSLCSFHTSLGENREMWLLGLPCSLAPFHSLVHSKGDTTPGRPALQEWNAASGAFFFSLRTPPVSNQVIIAGTRLGTIPREPFS